MQAILNLPEQVHISVRCTGIRLIGELCEWLNRHPQFIGLFVCSNEILINQFQANAH